MKYQDGSFAAARNNHSDRPDRMEAELTRWLDGLEPTGTPITLRFRTFADLRAEAALPRPRLPWLRSALSTMASLGSVVAGAGLLMLLAFIGATAQPGAAVAGSMGSGLSGAGPISVSTMGGDYTIGPDPVAILLFLFTGALAGCTILIPRLRRVVGRIAFGKSAAAPRDPLHFRRSWRSVTPIAWILSALAVGLTVWSICVIAASHYDEHMRVLVLDSMITQTTALFIPVAIAWRYPLRDRSARLLLFGALAAIANLLFSVVLYFLGSFPTFSQPLTAFWWVVSMLAFVALAAGIAGRAGTVRRPSLRLAALGVGAAFMYATIALFLYGYGSLQPQYLLESLTGYFTTWIVQAAWVAIAWVGIVAWRRGRGSWGWKLVLAAGTLHLLALAPNFINNIHQLLDPSNSSIGILGGWGVVTYTSADGGDFTVAPEFWWQLVTNSASQIALLVALLIGLRPPAPKLIEPTPEPAGAEPADAEPADAELADADAPTGERSPDPA
jgi:hypothetical protein